MKHTNTTDIVALHPLVLLNISEHTTRILAQNKYDTKSDSAQKIVCGALLGNAGNERVEIYHSFELLFSQESTGLELEYSHFDERLKQMKEIFPSDEFIGWYIVSKGVKVTSEIAELHKQIVTINSAAVLVVFDVGMASSTTGMSDSNDDDDGLAENVKHLLPISAYFTGAPEYVNIDVINRKKVEAESLAEKGDEGGFSEVPSMYYVEVDSASENSENIGGAGTDASLVFASRLMQGRILVESGEAERIAVEHVANISRLSDSAVANNDGGRSSSKSTKGKEADHGEESGSSLQMQSTSKICLFLVSQRNALEMLHQDIKVLQMYVEDVIKGKAQFDVEVMQQVKRVLVNRPVVQGDDTVFNRAMAQEETNVQMVSYLGAITDAIEAIRGTAQSSNKALQVGRNKTTPASVYHGGMFHSGFDFIPSDFALYPDRGRRHNQLRHRNFP